MTEDEVQALSCQQFEFITKSNIKINGLSNINESLSVHYLIYRIDNLENRKHYIGQHQTENPLDSYVGSGKIIRRAVEKEGIEKFVKTILFDFDNFEEMNEKEKELVPLSACYPNDPMSYNLREGGFAGQQTESQRIKISQTKIKNGSSKGEKNPMYGTSCKAFMTDEEIKQWKHNKSLAVQGSKNPRFGKSWTTGKSEEQLDQRRKRYQKTWEDKPLEEKQIRSQQQSNAIRAYLKDHKDEWLVKHNESLIKNGTNLSEVAKKREQNLTPEKLEQRVQNWKKTMNSKTLEERQQIGKKISLANTGKISPLRGKKREEFMSPSKAQMVSRRVSDAMKQLVWMSNKDGKCIRVKKEEVAKWQENGYNLGRKWRDSKR